MQPSLILLLIALYFGVLIAISFLTSRGNKTSENADFFVASRQSPWYLVAFGMIGASLSGVTFISIPGTIADTGFGYFQVVLGYTLGYAVIGTVLLPLYYRLNLTSIYTYLETRYGDYAYKTGASFFVLSRLVGSSFRLFLVANVLQLIVFDELNVPYYVTVTMTIFLIWLYTFRSGIKTIVWTDTLQTLFMLTAMLFAVGLLMQNLDVSFFNVSVYLNSHEEFQIFFFEDLKSSNYFFKQFISGAFIAIVMTGLDQDMMQKNLTCRSLKDAQKNMFWFTIVLVITNFLFLFLGLLLMDYANQNNFTEIGDALFPAIATSGDLGLGLAILFCIGLIAAAYSSADSALTSLTTSISIDLVQIQKKYDQKKQVIVRKRIHVFVTLLLIVIMMVYKYAITDTSLIYTLFEFAGYTYGPLLGLYAFGLFTKLKAADIWIPFISIGAVVLTFFFSLYLESIHDFELGFFVLIVNGALSFVGLILSSLKQDQSASI
ncbi:MAG: sodium:solute symporter [Psychroflexus halocasei]|uniref:sodium:solute symporter n=1 Tax=Psychroflexus sp. S27 TaxID=1982757 RepID=UPI000C2B1A09|nr:sodium:solute symporter [Psychroflexus sp. S27]PJX23297.1 sodium:solute symporter [Psychroflexus sp. S27]